MATLTVTQSEDYSDGSPVIPVNTTSINYATSGGVIATFASFQFAAAGGRISDTVAITGDGFANIFRVDLAVAGTFSAAGWTFSNWTAGVDVIQLFGTNSADTITGSS